MSNATFPVTLEEYCAEKSNTCRNPELIAMFYYQRKQAQNLRDTVTNYDTAFNALQTS
jgi:hypothetical protein